MRKGTGKQLFGSDVTGFPEGLWIDLPVTARWAGQNRPRIYYVQRSVGFVLVSPSE